MASRHPWNDYNNTDADGVDKDRLSIAAEVSGSSLPASEKPDAASLPRAACQREGTLEPQHMGMCASWLLT